MMKTNRKQINNLIKRWHTAKETLCCVQRNYTKAINDLTEEIQQNCGQKIGKRLLPIKLEDKQEIYSDDARYYHPIQCGDICVRSDPTEHWNGKLEQWEHMAALAALVDVEAAALASVTEAFGKLGWSN